MFEETYQAPWT